MLDWNSLYASGWDFGILPDSVADRILDYTGDKASKTLLDIGCGTGQLTRLFHDKGYACTGIDTSAKAVKIAASRSDQIKYEVFDLQRRPLEELDGPFGLITCKHVYAFIENRDLFLAKMAELLEQDGLFAIITPLVEDMPAEKQSIAVLGEAARQETTEYFDIMLDTPLKSGQLFLCRHRL